MTAPIHVGSNFQSHRDELRRSLNGALENRESYLGFLLGMMATLAIAFVVFAYWLSNSGILRG